MTDQPSEDKPDRITQLLQSLQVDANAPAPPSAATCNYCNGQRWIIAQDKASGRQVVVPCPHCPEGRAESERIWAQRFTQSGMPSTYRAYSFDTWDAMPREMKARKLLARAAMEAFVRSARVGEVNGFGLHALYDKLGAQYPLEDDPHRNSVVLYGPVGTSKTGLMVSAINALLGYKPVLYLSFEGFFESLNRAIREGNDTADLINQAKNAPVLALDEWTNERVSEYRQATLNDILRARLFARLPTIITTNYTVDQLRSEWGERVLDPVEANAHWIPVNGVNLRPKQQVTADDAP